MGLKKILVGLGAVLGIIFLIVSPASSQLEAKLEWDVYYAAPGYSLDEGNSVAVDNDGNVYVTGRSQGYGSGFDYLTLKYDHDGNKLWEVRYNGTGNGDDEALALKVDNAGYSYATGKSTGIGTDFDFATIKIDPSGNLLWAKRYNGDLDDIDIAKAIAVDSEGNIYVAGTARIIDVGWGRNDYAMLKYDANGNQLWMKYYDEGANDDLSDMVIDQDANVYVTGTVWIPLSCKDYITFKYDPDGNMLWRAQYAGAGGDDFAVSIGLDADRNVIVSGFSHDAYPLWNKYDTVKFDTNGNRLWKTRYLGGVSRNPRIFRWKG